MDGIKIKTIKDKRIWEDFVINKDPGSFLQSWNWGETHKNLGENIHRKGFFKNDELVGVMQLIKQSAKRGPHLLLPGGPLIDFLNERLRSAFVNEITQVCRQEKVWFVRARPELLNTRSNQDLFKNLGFIKAPMHLHAENTWVVDIDKTDEDLLYQMRKNTRYSVRKSLEQELEVEIVNDPSKVNILHELQKQTVERHGFVGFEKELFYEQLSNFGKDDQAALFLVKDKKSVVHVAAVIIFYGKHAFYHHSASTQQSRDNYASYFLQWKVMQEARRRGCNRYNMWGVAPNKDDRSHRFYGVTIFKTGFGGKRIDWLPAQDYRINILYWMTYGFEHLRKLRRGL